MPVRSFNSSVFVWPRKQQVEEALRRWAQLESHKHSSLLKLGYFGSYARGDWGVGSDLDLVVVIEDSTEPFLRRALSWDLSTLPVPADLIVYTLSEWNELALQSSRFFHTLCRKTVWISPVEPS